MVDFYVRKISVDRVKASNDFAVSGGPLLYRENVAGRKGVTYKILGLVNYFGTEYYAVNGWCLYNHFSFVADYAIPPPILRELQYNTLMVDVMRQFCRLIPFREE